MAIRENVSNNLIELRKLVSNVFQNPNTQIIFPRVYDDLKFTLENINYKNNINNKINEVLKTLNIDIETQNAVVTPTLTGISASGAKSTFEVGDTFVSDGSQWVLIPSGDEPSGTVTNVGIENTNKYKKNYFKINLGLSINEKWFVKRKFN